jgi:hypothetical protein
LSLEKLLEDFERKTFYVYKSGGRVVGVAALQIESEETGKIHWVYVRWAVNFYRKLGYGLVDKIERPWGFDVFMEKELESSHKKEREAIYAKHSPSKPGRPGCACSIAPRSSS